LRRETASAAIARSAVAAGAVRLQNRACRRSLSPRTYLNGGMTMNNMLKLLLPAALFLAGCGVVNNVGVIGKNLGRALSAHPYSVEEGKEKEILASGKGIVDVDFGPAGTAWARIAPDGTIEDENYVLTYNELGATGRRRSQLPPGTYFLNGVAGKDVMTGYYVRSIKMENFGWDDEKKQARCFSFTLEAGEVLIIPKAAVNTGNIKFQSDGICPKISFADGASTSPRYAIGPESR
jgi:hypothetical protein